MLESLFSFDDRNYQACQKLFRGSDNQEYYLGEYSIDSGSVIDVRAQRKMVGPYSIIRLRSKTRLFFRRSWTHIRDDAADVTVLWFVKKGRLLLSHQCGETVVNAGGFTITRSITPFSISCCTDEDELHEVFHVVLPTYIFQGHLKQDFKMGFSVSAESSDFEISERMLTTVFEDAGEISIHTEKLLVDSAMAVLAEAIKGRENLVDVRQTLSETRLQDILRYIEVNLSNPRLSAEMVAEGCGISKRYLSYIFKQHGLLFSEQLWDQRLKVAREALAASPSGEISIAQVAYRTGFKSPAHFSRLFKRVFHETPREYRTAFLKKHERSALSGRSRAIPDDYSRSLQSNSLAAS